MTPERWRRIDDLFDFALRLGPEEREAWVREVGAGETDLRQAVGCLLAQDNQAEAEGFLTSPVAMDRGSEATRSWTSQERRLLPKGHESLGNLEAESVSTAGGFSHEATIVRGPEAHPLSESESVVRARLREVPMIYILFLAMATFYRVVVLGNDDLVIYYVELVVTSCLVGAIALLSSRVPVSLSRLKALELGMLALFAFRDAVVEYRLVLMYSQNHDPVMAQLTVKNLVLLTCILILTYGLYVPKTWRRAVFVTGPLALLPFATLFGLYVMHPDEMRWLGEGITHCESPRLFLFSFDAMTLLLVAAGSAIGASTISRLRRQVAEARQLGQYRLLRRIGGGGMGEVYLAEHQFLKRPCALKLIQPSAALDPIALARFEREVQLTATLSHPNTIEIFDYGRTDDGSYFYVMEFLPGLTLSELVGRYGPLPPGRAVYLLRQVCLALREAHAAGLIHRDIKPSNIFAARRGGMDDVAKLLDFGLVRPAATPVAHLSDEGQIVGTPLFMSPEQALGRHELDERSDIYSLGAVAYYLLTGKPPFDGQSEIGTLIAHAREQVKPPSRVNSDIPHDLERVVMSCLAKSPAERFPDAASLERALEGCACAADWNQDRAARWWQDAGRVFATPS
jgi:eukaryotic-like serine/threonine-protein kinase